MPFIDESIQFVRSLRLSQLDQLSSCLEDRSQVAELHQKGILWGVAQNFNPGRPPKFELQPATHHMTLLFGVELSDVQHLIGKKFSAKEIAECWDDRNHALLFDPPEGVPCQNSKPHISLSWSRESNAARSNHMLNLPHHTTSRCKIFEFVVEFQPWER